MGSKSSTSGTQHANFISDSDSCTCPDHSNQIVEEIEWYAVPTMSTGARVGANIGRGLLDVITLGTAEIGFQGKRLSHDALRARIRCKKCGRSSIYILEFTTGGSKMKCGNYEYYSPIDGSWTLYPRNMSYSNLRSVYESKEKSASDYDLVWYNCKHWAKEVYYYIKRNYCYKR